MWRSGLHAGVRQNASKSRPVPGALPGLLEESKLPRRSTRSRNQSAHLKDHGANADRGSGQDQRVSGDFTTGSRRRVAPFYFRQSVQACEEASGGDGHVSRRSPTLGGGGLAGLEWPTQPEEPAPGFARTFSSRSKNQPCQFAAESLWAPLSAIRHRRRGAQGSSGV